MVVKCPICNTELEHGEGACPVCGYHVIGQTQGFKPVKIDPEPISVDAHAPVNRRYDLRVVRGPQTGIDIALQEGTLSVGRDPRCDLFLNDMTVSRNHAELEVKPEGCILRDKNSFNGVWVNDRTVETCLLKSGDLIQIGAFCLLYRESV